MNLLITGSRTGIGQALARHFLAAGHAVWGAGRRDQAGLHDDARATPGTFRATVCDVADWSQVAAWREAVGRAWSHVDVLITCAGVQGPIGPAMQLDPAAWSANLRTNLDGTFFTIRAFHDLLRRSPRRSRVFCFSGGGSTGPRPNFLPYACAKAGVVRLVENLAAEFGSEPPDLLAIAPGGINTAMTEEVLALGPAVVGEKEFATATRQKATGGSPVARVAAMIDHLCTPAGDGITGKLISVPWDPWERFGELKAEFTGNDIYTLRRIVPEDRGRRWSA